MGIATGGVRHGHSALPMVFVFLSSWAMAANADSHLEGGTSVIVGKAADGSGQPVPHAMVTISGNPLPATSVTVFTDEKGEYRFRAGDLGAGLKVNELDVTCQKLGYHKSKKKVATSPSNSPARVDCLLTAANNVADEVPASAWLGMTPNTMARDITTKQCVQCHQLPFNGAKVIAASTKAQSTEDREALWRGIVTYMRQMSNHVAGLASRRRFENRSTDWRSNPDEAFLNAGDEDIIAPFLAKYLPTDFSYFDPEKYVDPSPVGAKGTVIHTYYIEPSANGWYREVMVSKQSPYVWGVDLGQDRMLKLDPSSGEYRWLNIPGKGPMGPHTITPDADGNLWVSLEEIAGLGIFDPKTEKWKIFADVLEPGLVSHDFATDSQGQVALDQKGRAWITIVSGNNFAAFDPQTGKVEYYELPERADGSKAPTLPYGTAMTRDGKHVWFSQHNADVVGSLNTETGKVDFVQKLPTGTAPRRMQISDDDVLWVALSGSSQLLEVNTRTKKFKVHDLPDRASSPYNAVWDPVRKVVWVGTTNADKIYRFDPKVNAFTQYPLPHAGAYLRMLSIDPKSGDLWTIYANKTGAKAPTFVIKLSLDE